MNYPNFMRFALVLAAGAAVGCSSNSTSTTTAPAADAQGDAGQSDTGQSDAAQGDTVGGDTAASDATGDTAAVDSLSDTGAADTSASDASPSDTATPGDTGASDTGASDTASSDAISTAPVPLEQFTAKIYEAMCTAMITCGGGAFATLEGCMGFLSSQMEGQDGPAGIVALVKAGTVTYDAVAAGKCMGMYTNCALISSGKAPGDCAAVFTGTLSDGAACTEDEACKSGYCKQSDMLDSSCPGVCAAQGKVGAACQEDDGCEGSLLCIGEVCAAAGGKSGDPCSGNSCGDGLYCASADGPTNTCQPKLSANMPCADEKACKPGLFCGMSTSGDEQICQPQAKLGEPCGGASGSGGGSGGFGSDAFGAPIGPCEGSAICASPGIGKPSVCVAKVKVGEACSSDAQCGGMDVQCAGLSDGKPGTCQPLPGKEQACAQPDFTKGQLFTCQLPLVCDAASSKCVDPPGAGQSCLLFCAKGLTCSGGKCTAKATEGQPCGAAPCADGLMCEGDKCVKVSCTAP